MHRSVGIALIDQALLSLFNLGLNLVLISLAAPVEFGRFIFASAVVLLMTSLQNALVATPLAALIPGRTSEQQAATATTIISADVALRWGAAVVTPLLCLLTDHDIRFLGAAACVAFTSLARETARALALAHERTIECLRLDAGAVAASILAIAALWWVVPPATAALGGIAIGNGLALLLLVRTRIPHYLPVIEALRTYRSTFWADTQWSLIGAGTTELQYRSYVFALELFRDAISLATVQAGRLLLGPLPLVVGAWGRVARPAMARHLATGSARNMIQLTAQGMAYVLIVAACYCLVLYLLWPIVEARFFNGRYSDVGRMTTAWAIYMVMVISHMVLSVPLQASMRLKELAQVTMATAVLSCILMAGLTTNVPVIYAVYALIATEFVALVWILVLVIRLARHAGTPTLQPTAPAL